MKCNAGFIIPFTFMCGFSLPTEAVEGVYTIHVWLGIIAFQFSWKDKNYQEPRSRLTDAQRKAFHRRL